MHFFPEGDVSHSPGLGGGTTTYPGKKCGTATFDAKCGAATYAGKVGMALCPWRRGTSTYLGKIGMALRPGNTGTTARTG